MEKQILAILSKDARTSPEKIAVMLDKTEQEVIEAIDKLEQRGVIRGYRTIIDWEKAGREQVNALIDVRVSPSRGVGFDDVARRIYKFGEVKSVYLVSGEYDLRVVVEGKTMHEVAFFVAEKLATLEGVLSTRTSFLLKTYKEDGVVYGEKEVDDRLPVS